MKLVHAKRAPNGHETVYTFEGLGRLVKPKTGAQRKALSRRFRHSYYMGPASGRTIYFPKRVFNMIQREVKLLEKKYGLDYLCAYEALSAPLAAKEKGGR